MYKFTTVTLIIVTGFLLSADHTSAAVIQVGHTTGQADGQEISVPIMLTKDATENISALQFDIIYDTSQLVYNTVTLGSAALDAQKEISATQVRDGTIRVVIYALNQTSLTDGPVAHVAFNIRSAAVVGSTALTCRDAVAADIDAAAVDISVQDGTIEITGSTGSGNSSGSHTSGGAGCFVQSMRRVKNWKRPLATYNILNETQSCKPRRLVK